MATRAGKRKSRIAAVAEADDDIRMRLLEAAHQVFAESGFQAATIRDICDRAEANVAAVNYHFGDKLGIYREVLRRCIGGIHPTAQQLPKQIEDVEKELRQFLLVLLQRLSASHAPSSSLRVVAHELAQPSPALPEVVHQLISPNYNRLRGMLARILGRDPDDETTRLYAHSLIGQVIHYAHARPVISILWPDLKMTPKDMERIAEHIADFSICSLREAARKNKRTK